MFADREEDAGGAFIGQRLQHRRRVVRPGAVIEGQHHLVVAQEVELLEMLEAEAGPPVVSISTVRPIPSASGLLQAARAGCGNCTGAGTAADGAAAARGAGAWGAAPLVAAACGAAACGAAPLVAGGVCDHAALEESSETALAKISPAAMRMVLSLNPVGPACQAPPLSPQLIVA